MRERQRENREAITARVREYRRRNPEKALAQSRLKWAVKPGEVVRPNSCQACGAEGRTLSHHPDYARPLYVIHICHRCHSRHHAGDSNVVVVQPTLTPFDRWAG